MIDITTNERELASYCEQNFAYLYAPLSPELQYRRGFITIEEKTELERSAPVHLAWLDTPAYDVGNHHLRDRARGAMLGLAIGNAIGASRDGSERDSSHVSDLTGGGRFGLEPGEWIDATSMALCLADSILAEGRPNSAAFAGELVDWYRSGKNTVRGRCVGIGTTTRTAIERLEAPGSRWQGSSDPDTAENGSLVRLAPLAIAARNSLSRLWTFAKSQSGVTHGAAEAVSACQFFSMLMRHALNGGGLDQVLTPKIAQLSPRLMLINSRA